MLTRHLQLQKLLFVSSCSSSSSFQSHSRLSFIVIIRRSLLHLRRHRFVSSSLVVPSYPVVLPVRQWVNHTMVPLDAKTGRKSTGGSWHRRSCRTWCCPRSWHRTWGRMSCACWRSLVERGDEEIKRLLFSWVRRGGCESW
ncbi:hypothetical protein Micbo1qcDRAFT_155625 [Microdochium bolleyi]|uniref:Uncharacterized protein n=1 Tax=Microdochium bolleyi TaxID=196109 RepID=A0A136JID9_9PEZI|nr:hypothetical protein Micbo1qcDRAFT_155625 [Microdochium bolleyi]